MKNRRQIDPRVLATAAKWSKPKLRKKYTYAPKKLSIAQYVKNSNSARLKKRFSKQLNKSKLQRKPLNALDEDGKVHSKFDSMNNFANLKSQNIEFAKQKNKDRRNHKLKKLDTLAWENVAIPENDKIFGSIDNKGNECGVGQLQVIDSKTFFENYNLNNLNIEEYVLDDNVNNKNVLHKNSVYDDRMGLKKTLDINVFGNESMELFNLLQFSLYKIDPSKTVITNKTMMNHKDNDKQQNGRKKLKKRKTMKEKAAEKKIKSMSKKYPEDILFRNQTQIDGELMKILGINATEKEFNLKLKAKQKWMQHKKTKLEHMNNNNDGPPMKKRKLSNGKKGEFRKQIENLHEKQNIQHVTQKWNSLLSKSSNDENKNENKNEDKSNDTNSDLLSHLNINEKMNDEPIKQNIEIESKYQLNKILKQCNSKLLIIDFYAKWCGPCKIITPKINQLAEQYSDNIQVVKIDIDKLNALRKEYNINCVPTFLLMDPNKKKKKQITRIKGAKFDSIMEEINKLNIKPNEKKQENKCKSKINMNELHPSLLKGIADLGFVDPTNIQKEVIPNAIDGNNDILIAAATGSGKTLSFGIPIVNDLLYHQSDLDSKLYGLIMTPTRELAIQIESHLKSLLKYSTLQCVSIIGGMSLSKQRRLLNSSPEIIIATPGRIWQLMQENESLHLRDFTHLRYLVLDEADRLLSSAHYMELNHILKVIKTVWDTNEAKQHFPLNSIPIITTENSDVLQFEDNNYNLMNFLEQNDDEQISSKSAEKAEEEEKEEGAKEKNEKKEKKEVKQLPLRRQTFIVSATLTLESINRQTKTESKVPVYANMASIVPFQSNIKVADQTPKHKTSSNVMEYGIPLDMKDKDAMLTYLIHEYQGRTLVFSNTIGAVKRVTLILKELGLNVYAIHSQQQQRQRLKNLDRFVNTKKCALICTDICARGLDIPSVDNVIHFQVPLSAEDYIHRAGRVGRRESKQYEIKDYDGNSFLLISAEENKLYNRIILALNREEGLNKLSINERLLSQIRRQVAISKRIASLLDESRRTHRKQSNLKKMADAAGIELDEINCRALNIMKTDENSRNDQSTKRKKFSKKNKHKSFEYGIHKNSNGNSNGLSDKVIKEIKHLRKELKQLTTFNDLKRPKSSYLTKTYVNKLVKEKQS